MHAATGCCHAKQCKGCMPSQESCAAAACRGGYAHGELCSPNNYGRGDDPREGVPQSSYLCAGMYPTARHSEGARAGRHPCLAHF